MKVFELHRPMPISSPPIGTPRATYYIREKIRSFDTFNNFSDYVKHLFEIEEYHFKDGLQDEIDKFVNKTLNSHLKPNENKRYEFELHDYHLAQVVINDNKFLENIKILELGFNILMLKYDVGDNLSDYLNKYNNYGK